MTSFFFINREKMKLLHQDLKATDPLYRIVQEPHPQFNPPTLFLDRVEDLYATCHDLVDEKFPIQIKSQFGSCYSELYFGATFRQHLGLRVSHPSDEGPDFYLHDLDCWAEIVTLSSGAEDNPNSILPIENGMWDHMKVREQIMLRITSSFMYKSRKILEYIEKKIIGNSQRVIICINGGWLKGPPLIRFPYYPVGGFPEVVSALLPIGNMVFLINKGNRRITEKTFEFRDTIAKQKNDTDPIGIKSDYFIDHMFAHISAVIYSYANICDTIDDSSLGRDFFVIHNPLAKHPIPLGSFKCGIEYKVEFDGEIISIQTIDYKHTLCLEKNKNLN
jgi:hypothetical protein